MSRFTVMTVAVASYPKNPAWTVLEATKARDKVAGLLTRHGGIVEDHSSAALSKESIHPFFNTWTHRSPWSGVLYWTGHAEYSEDDGYLLALGESTEPLVDANAVTEASLTSAVVAHRRSAKSEGTDSWLLVILDTCRSQQGAWNVWKALRERLHEPPDNIGVIGTAEGDGAHVAGRFAALLERKLAGFTGNDTEGIVIGELVRRLLEAGPDGHLQAGRQIHHAFPPTARLPLADNTPPPLKASVADGSELQRVLAKADPSVRNHFYAKAQGSEITQPAWHFTGRLPERRRLTTWLRTASSGIQVVTGVAGSGKSALLGMLLASSDSQIVGALEALNYPKIPDSARPSARTFNAVTHLSGRTILEVVTHLGTQLPSRPDRLDDIDSFVKRLAEVAADSPPYTILADALDESRDPSAIAALLRRLAGIPNVRVLVGTRQSLHETPDKPTPPDSNLLNALTTDEHQIMRLGRDEGAIYDYTLGRLTMDLPSGLPSRDDIANQLADEVSHVDQPFLFARLAVYEILANPRWQQPQADLGALLGHGHSGIFNLAVARIRAADPTAEALLHALAYARGNGFPRSDGIWAAAAEAFTDQAVTDDDVERALDLAAPYIMQDTEFGCAVYRLAHRTFTERYLVNDQAEDNEQSG